jgi:hypothetical protein
VDANHPRAPATIKTLVCDPGPNNWLATEYSHATVAVDKYYTRLAAANGLDKTLRLGQKPTSKNCESAVCMGDAEIFVCNDVSWQRDKTRQDEAVLGGCVQLANLTL